MVGSVGVYFYDEWDTTNVTAGMSDSRVYRYWFPIRRMIDTKTSCLARKVMFCTTPCLMVKSKATRGCP